MFVDVERPGTRTSVPSDRVRVGRLDDRRRGLPLRDEGTHVSRRNAGHAPTAEETAREASTRFGRSA